MLLGRCIAFAFGFAAGGGQPLDTTIDVTSIDLSIVRRVWFLLIALTLSW
jgi:hypothetical protein